MQKTMQAPALNSPQEMLMSVHGTCRHAHRTSQTLTSQCMLSRGWSSTTVSRGCSTSSSGLQPCQALSRCLGALSCMIGGLLSKSLAETNAFRVYESRDSQLKHEVVASLRSEIESEDLLLTKKYEKYQISATYRCVRLWEIKSPV